MSLLRVCRMRPEPGGESGRARTWTPLESRGVSPLRFLANRRAEEEINDPNNLL